MRKVWGKR